MCRKDLLNAVDSVLYIIRSNYSWADKVIRENDIEIKKKVVDFQKKNNLFCNEMYFSWRECNNITGTYVILQVNGEDVARVMRILPPEFDERSLRAEGRILARQERRDNLLF